MQTIAIVDYGMGNLRSVVKAMEYVSPKTTKICLTAAADDINRADRVIFPGQGAAAECMAALQRSKLLPAVLQAARDKPFLGICMGLQVLLDYSEENNGVNCLGLIPGRVRFLGDIPALQQIRAKIPHMGWNAVKQSNAHPLWQQIPDQAQFYFVHSYYAQPNKMDTVAGTVNYGIDFPVAVSHHNIFAVQFHPEKSAEYGLQLLQNFIDWDNSY